MTMATRGLGDGYYQIVTTGVQLCTAGKTGNNYLGGVTILSTGTGTAPTAFAVYDGTSTSGTQIWGTAGSAALGATVSLNWPAYTGLYAVASAGGSMAVKYGDGDG